jgi:hypothetical protein
MSREPEWKFEIREALRHESWTVDGPRRLIKVVRLETIINKPTLARAVGYVTQELYLLGKTPRDIEHALGLPPFSLLRGCRIYSLTRLPGLTEYTHELTADRPDGLAFDPGTRVEARYRYENDSGLREVPYYPPGSQHIPQWKVTAAIPLRWIADLPPNFKYQPPRPA